MCTYSYTVRKLVPSCKPGMSVTVFLLLSVCSPLLSVQPFHRRDGDSLINGPCALLLFHLMHSGSWVLKAVVLIFTILVQFLTSESWILAIENAIN